MEEEKKSNEKPRQWLIDRCDGDEKVMNPNSRPCCAIFYAPLVLKWFPGILEQNRVMECLGRTGVTSNVRARKWIMILALLSTIVGWGFLIYSDFAISTQYDFIEAAAFNYGSNTIQFANTSGADIRNSTRISLGLRAAAISNFTFDENDQDYSQREEDRRVIGFDEFCTEQATTDQIIFVNPEQCNACQDASHAMVTSILMSTVTYFFTFTTDVLRIWPNYDVNCQKVFGAFFAIFSAVMGLRTFFLFRNQCYASFNTGWTCLNEDMEQIDCGDDFDNPELFIKSYMQWQRGPGLLGLGVATFAKLLDLVCNFLIPTPSITRDRNEQWEYEKLATAQEDGESNGAGVEDISMTDVEASARETDVEASAHEAGAEADVETTEQKTESVPTRPSIYLAHPDSP